MQASVDVASSDHNSPLGGWRVLRTNNIAGAYDTIASAFTEHKFKVSGDASRADTCLHRLDLKDVSVNYIKYGVDVEIDPDFLETFYLIHMPIHGRSDVWYDGRRMTLDENAAAICSPTRRLVALASIGGMIAAYSQSRSQSLQSMITSVIVSIFHCGKVCNSTQR